MDLKFVVPNVQATFGNLTFASKISDNRVQNRTVSHTYELFSDRQRADNIRVTVPAEAGDKADTIEPDEKVTLLNVRLTLSAYKIGDIPFVDYVCSADDIIKA